MPKNEITNAYYANNAKKLRKIVDNILQKFGGIYQKDYDDFYSLANEVFVDVLEKYDASRNFDTFLYSCLSNKIKSKITSMNCVKRACDKTTLSLDMPVYGEEDDTLGDSLESDFSIERELTDDFGEGKAEVYLNHLSNVQRQIIEMRMNGIAVKEIKKRLALTDKTYNTNFQQLKSFGNLCLLFDNNTIPINEEETKMVTKTQTVEKSKTIQYSIASINKKIENRTIRFDHPLQRQAEQWSPVMKGNLISDILQGNPIPALVFAEQIVNGMPVIWDLDGKQRCTNAYSFCKDAYKVSRNIRRWNIKYQSQIRNDSGEIVLDENGFPISEWKECDIRGKKFSQLPEELQEKFNDYTFECIQYLNCNAEEIGYHIIRYNEGKAMTAPQKGLARLGEEYAAMVKSISAMSFFRDKGGYKVSEFKNGTINRVVVESVMAANYLQGWNKRQEVICEFLKENAKTEDFENFENMVMRIEKVITNEVADMFDSKNSFLWFGLFAKFEKMKEEDKKFVAFMAEFSHSLHSKEIGGVSFDKLSQRSTKDKNVVLDKMHLLERLMKEYFSMPEITCGIRNPVLI